MAKMTVHQILEAISDVRKLTSPPDAGETKTVGIDQVVEADQKLLDLQERLLDDYGLDLQTAQPAS